MNTLFIGHQLIELDCVDSTNTFAFNMIKEQSVNEGTVIWAKAQIQGRGQRGNTWYAQPNANLTFSIILKPTLLPIHLQFELHKICSLAITDTLKALLHPALHPTIAIKWPNDIYVGDKKIAGILIETIIRTANITHAVIGIGLNVNQTTFNTLAGNPTSLKLLSAINFDLRTVLHHICMNTEARYLQHTTNKHELINNNYTTLLYRLNAWHYFRIGNETVRGMITGVSPTGLLNITFNDKCVQLFDINEIRYIG